MPKGEERCMSDKYLRIQELRSSKEVEIFQDVSYFDMWCVRFKGDRDFNSPLSFHFDSKSDAGRMKALLEKAR